MHEKYDLEILLTLRERQKQQAEQRYKECVSAWKHVSTQVEQLENDIRIHATQRRDYKAQFQGQRGHNSTSVATMCQHEEYLKHHKEHEIELERNLLAVQEIQQSHQKKVEKAFADYVEAARELKLVERHYEKWRQDLEQIQRRKQEREMNELGLRSWTQRNL